VAQLDMRDRVHGKKPADALSKVEDSNLAGVAGGKGNDVSDHGRRARHDPPRQTLDSQDNGLHPGDVFPKTHRPLEQEKRKPFGKLFDL
jgi:hypothetical protein